MVSRVDSVVDKVLKKRKKRAKIRKVLLKYDEDGNKLESSGKQKRMGKRVNKALRKNGVKSKNKGSGNSGNASAINTQLPSGGASRRHTRLKNKLLHVKNGNVKLHNEDEVLVNGDNNDNSLIPYTRVGQGKELFPGLDGRSFIARRLKDLYYDMTSDMGGEDNMSTIEKGLSKQMASLFTIGEDMVAQRAIDDPEYDYLEHVTLVKTLNGTARVLGIKRRMKTLKETKLSDLIEGEAVSDE